MSNDCYRVTVTSIENPSLLLLNSEYDWVADEVGDMKRSGLHEMLSDQAPTLGEKIFLLKKFDDDTETFVAIMWAKKNGCRLAYPAEREAFIKANPDLQREFWIVDLGSCAFVPNEGMCAAIMYAIDDKEDNLHKARVLFYASMHDDWPADFRFLFVRK